MQALWKCPTCGQTFVVAKVWHSCVNVPLEAHFDGKPPVRKVEKFGNNYVHGFVLSRQADVDARVAGLLKEAYAVDRRRHGAAPK